MFNENYNICIFILLQITYHTSSKFIPSINWYWAPHYEYETNGKEAILN